MIKHTFDNTFINISSRQEYFKVIDTTARQNNVKKVFFYLNSYSYYLINKNELFRKAFNCADYIIPDGTSIVWGMKQLNKKRIEKVTFNHSFFEYLINYFIDRKLNIYLLGSIPATVKKAAENLSKKYPGIQIAGFKDGFFTIDEIPEILKHINNANPDILLVGMGMPKSEIFIIDNLDNIKSKCIFTVGNIFDIIAGERKIAPDFLVNSGFEWLYRLLQEPQRLISRYIKANGYFVCKMIRIKLTNS